MRLNIPECETLREYPDFVPNVDTRMAEIQSLRIPTSTRLVSAARQEKTQFGQSSNLPRFRTTQLDSARAAYLDGQPVIAPCYNS